MTLFLISLDPSGNEVSRWKINTCSDMVAAMADPDENFIYKAVSGERVKQKEVQEGLGFC